MADARIERLAAVLVGYSVDVQPGEVVTIEGPLAAKPLSSSSTARCCGPADTRCRA